MPKLKLKAKGFGWLSNQDILLEVIVLECKLAEVFKDAGINRLLKGPIGDRPRGPTVWENQARASV